MACWPCKAELVGHEGGQSCASDLLSLSLPCLQASSWFALKKIGFDFCTAQRRGRFLQGDGGGGWPEVRVRASRQGWEPWGCEPAWQDAADCIFLPSSRPGLVRRAPDHSRGFFHGEQSPFYFFFFSLDLAVGKELETICTRKYRLKNECVSPSPLGRAALTAEVRQQCVRRPASCQ